MQQFYGIDIDHAMNGAHTPIHIAALVEKLPPKSRVLFELDKDSYWDLPDILMATLINHFRLFVWSLGGAKGAEPERIGPSWMKKKANSKKLEAMAMPIDSLLEELSKPRKGVKNG